MSNEHILIVDDEPSLQQAIAQYLEISGFTVGCVADGIGFDEYMSKNDVDLLILDQMMPGEDGLSITRRLRSSDNDIPILMLSSFGEDVDRIIGLEVGVDDYLAKPPNLREVLARIKALLRRNQKKSSPNSKKILEYQFGSFSYNIETKQLLNKKDPIKLTSTEAKLLTLFVQNPNKELSRDHLSRTLKGYEHDPFDRSIDVLIKRVREKIEQNTSAPQFIITVWGKGYQFIPD
ncbi:MAG: response regulator [Gammaproteobacteria bacterium]|nr:response regulator [Gammaproteobacteria bacterium]